MLKVVGASWLQTKISSYILAGMGILCIVMLFIGEVERIEDDGNYAATVYWSPKADFRIEFWGQGNELAEVPKGVARAYYRPDLSSNGWSLLEIESDGSYPDWVQAYAAGLLEGALTWQLIHWQWQNIIESRCEINPADCTKIKQKLEENMAGVRNRGHRNHEEVLWHQINLFYHQVDGLSTGWNFAIKRSRNEIELPLVDFIWLNSLSDIPVIERMLNLTSRTKAGEDLPGLSAAFVRLVTEKEEKENTNREKVIVGHNSAGSYNIMLRLMKHYKLNYHEKPLPSSPKVPGTSITFTGYPAAISSQDDLYTVTGETAGTKHHKAVTGTAINNFNEKLWTKVNLVDHVLIGPRVMAANRLANSGLEWSKLISRVNSGTTLKQWTVLNMANLTTLNASAAPAPSPSPGTSTASPDHSLYRYIHSLIDLEVSQSALWNTIRRQAWRSDGPGLLWVIEQLPGHTHAADQTNVLRAKGYWANYGIPHYQDIREISGIKHMEAKYGNTYSLLTSARAILFKNGFETATDIDTVMLLMRSNHYDKEVISNDKLAIPKPKEGLEVIEPEDIVSDSGEVKQIIQSLETVKSHIESTDSDGVSSILTLQELKDITAQVDEILEQLFLTDSGETKEGQNSESASAEHLNLNSDSVEEIEDRLVDEGSWHGLGARGDLHGWLGEERYGLVPMGVIDTKALSATSDGIQEFEAISGPAYSRALEASLESLLKPATRKKAKFGFAALLDKIRKSNLRFVKEDDDSSSEEEEEPKDFEEALEHVVNTNIQIDPPKPYSVPPFQWSKSDFKSIPHIGQPDLWSFDIVKPSWVW